MTGKPHFAPALTLSGGGARAAYQVGVIQALAEILPQAQIPFPILCGTSAGSVNLAYLAARADRWPQAAAGLVKLWEKIQLEDIYATNGLAISRIASKWVTRSFLGGLGGQGEPADYLLDTKPLDRLIRREVDFAAIAAHLHHRRLDAVAFSAVQYVEQATVAFFASRHRIREWSHSGRRSERCRIERHHVLASAAIPVFFPPVRIGEHYFGDGCLRQTSPLSPPIHLGASRILSVGIRPTCRQKAAIPARAKRKPPTLAEILGEMFNALFLDSMATDIERAERINDALRDLRKHKGFSFSRPLRDVPLLHLAPSRNLTDLLPPVIDRFPALLGYCVKALGVSESEHQGKELLSYLAFLPECSKPLIELGYEDAMKRRHEVADFLGEDHAAAA